MGRATKHGETARPGSRRESIEGRLRAEADGDGEFHEPGFVSALFCADSSSPQISTIRVGHFTMENDSLRKTSTKLAQKNYKILAREIP